jgi:hypothetical protein
MTFCSSYDCTNTECYRNPQRALNELDVIPEDKRLPMALANFKDTDRCIGYRSLAERIGIDIKIK